ncbi:MAG TPA: LPS-assembly protein LptD [Pseudomonadales bacterium]|nr:LPS-assembly protein LptD [Pseudomonadales bacterium]
MRAALPLVGALLAAPTLVHAFTEDQWHCEPGADGQWACTEVGVDAGPFEPVPTAPIYSQREAREQARGRTGVVAGQTTEQAELTWVPRQALPQAARETLPSWCGGAYQEFAWTEEQLAADPVSALLGLSADSAEYVLDEGGTLDGKVRVEQGARRVGADTATYDAAAEELVLEGDILVQEPGLLLRGDAARVDLLTGDARIDGARFVLYEGGYRGSAEALVREDKVLSIENGAFTHCPPGDESWKLAAGRIEIPEGSPFGVARNATLEIADVPVFWAPYLEFPVTDERHSGLLFPTVGYSNDNGADLSVPYYMNLAPNYDATLTPRFMSERGLLIEGEARQLTGQMRNTIGGAWIKQDDNYDGERSFDEFRERVRAGLEPPGVFRAEERWLASFEHQGRWLPGITSQVDFAEVSDKDYLRDLGTELSVNNQPDIRRTGAINLRRGGLEASLWAEDFQILEDGTREAYQRLPQFDLSWHERFGDVPMVFGADFQYAEFERNGPNLTGVDAITGSRTHIVPRFTLPLEWDWAWMEANFAWDYTRWDLQGVPLDGTGQPVVDRSPTRTLPTGSLDLGLRFERDLAFGGTRLLQTLEPRLFYLYIREEDQSGIPLFDTADLTFGTQQLFRDNRFSGIDRIGDANQLSVALTQRLLSKGDGTELLSATVGRIIYFDDRDVTLTNDPAAIERNESSGWITDLVMRLGAGLDARALWVWDSEDDARDQTNLRLRYRASGRGILNVGYRKRGMDIEQVDAGFSWPVTDRTALIGRYFYDLERENTIEMFAGVQYDDCCWRLRLVGRQYRRPYDGVDDTDTETGVFVEVVMKGLAGFDGGLQSILEEGIYGYGEQGAHGSQL